MADRAVPPFHLALAVDDLSRAEAFYVGVLGAEVVARDADWLVLDLFGHKLTLNRGTPANGDIAHHHFGVVLDAAAFAPLADRIAAAGAAVAPAALQHAGTSRAQWVLFARDPAGNGLEFNAFPGGTWQGQLAAAQRME